jgi:hypothetical protein
MQRLRDYLGFLAWQSGISYIAVWALTFWTFDWGFAVFGGSGACRPDNAKVLFYWVCDSGHPLSILAAVVNAALTVTVWAPVYVAAATVRPDAVAIAVPIVAAHLVGLPTAIFVMIRVMLKFFALARLAGARLARKPTASLPAHPNGAGPLPAHPNGAGPPPAPSAAFRRAPRASFGLRAQSRRRRA